jgi:hypothetical protein
MKQCKHPTCGDTCRRVKKPKKKTRIKRHSAKRSKQNTAYSKQSKEIRAEQPICQVKSPVCTIFSQGAHHVSGRTGDRLTDREKQIGCCNACNTYIEDNSQWAKDNGFKIPDYSTTRKILYNGTNSNAADNA